MIFSENRVALFGIMPWSAIRFSNAPALGLDPSDHAPAKTEGAMAIPNKAVAPSLLHAPINRSHAPNFLKLT
jgi:hypothetical protein